MTALPFDIARCSGVIRFNAGADGWPAHEMCQERDTCKRYLSLVHWDRGVVPDYRGIPVSMAVPDCGHKIEAEASE